jgi:Rieske Fe-S protein
MGGALRPTRRTVLTAAAATGAAGVLGACGGDGSSDTASGADATTAAPETTTATPTTSPTQQAQSPATSAEALAKVSDVAVGAGVVNDSAKVVVTQPTQGQFKGFTAVCTHQGCLVDRVQNNVIFCPCHGSQYSAEDGSVISPPAPAPLSAVAVKVEGDSVVRA